jgi:hypothetical protein
MAGASLMSGAVLFTGQHDDVDVLLPPQSGGLD